MRCVSLILVSLPVFAQTVTFNRDIAPIVFRYCAPCHHNGESAPFPLLTYQDVRKRAKQIVLVTGRGYMPPWLPSPGFGEFIGEGRLSEGDLQRIADWVKLGASEGSPGDLPPAPQFAEGWQMGQPNLIVQTAEPYRVPAAGSDLFRNFVLPIHLSATRYVSGIELRPGNKRLVHHANIWIDHRQTLRSRDHQDGQPGFPGMDVSSETRSDAFAPDSHFLFWKPGSVLRHEPADMNWVLDPGSDLILNMHLQPSGREETLQPSVGLYFSSQPPKRHPMLVQLEHDGAIDIPPGSTQFVVSDRLTLPVDVEVLAIYPHAHYLGKRVEAWATLPDTSRRWLIKIEDWDLNWQAVYVYKNPVALPRGTVVEMRVSYDNSASNPRNPNHVPVRVRAGPRSADEMGHVWLQLLPTSLEKHDPRYLLQEAVMLRRLEKYPDDFVAHCNLGSLLEMSAEYQEAMAHFERALRIAPASATARTGLGGAYLGSGRLDESVREFKAALRNDPLHRNARWNLAQALMKKGDPNSAADELEALLRSNPDDFDAHVSVGTVYFFQHRYDAALPHYRQAVRLRPSDVESRVNLGGLLAVRGDLAGAIQEFEEALKLDPNHRSAREYLGRARAALKQ